MNFIDPQPKWTDDGIPMCASSCRYFDSVKRGCQLTDCVEGTRCKPALVALRTPTKRRLEDIESMQDFLTGKFASLDATFERDYELNQKRHAEVLERLEETEVDLADRIDETKRELSRDIRVLGAKIDKTSRDSKRGFASQADVDAVQEQRLQKLEELTSRSEQAAILSEQSAVSVGQHATAAQETEKNIKKMLPSKKQKAATAAGGLVVMVYAVIEIIDRILKATGK